MPRFSTYTGTNLWNLDWYKATNQGALNREAARFGLELAQLAYDFEVGQWLEAGWTDITIQVNSRLFSGVRSSQEANSWRQQALNLVLPRLAHHFKALANPVAEIRGLLKQEQDLETGKAIVLLKPDGEGRFTIAIGFMGTGKRAQDWLGNMRFLHEDHLHEGFSAIARQFMENEEDIHFPTAALALGLPDLTLKDVLSQCQKEDSPFRLVMAGHSQGAAVLQVWTWRKMREGIKREYLNGFGYAAPVVASGFMEEDYACPLTLFLAEDDVFTRVGLKHHIGRAYRLAADKVFRATCYGKYEENPLFLAVLDLFHRLSGTQVGLLFCLGYLKSLSALPEKVIMESLATFLEKPWAESLAELPVKAEEWSSKLIMQGSNAFSRFYLDVTGEDPIEEEVEEMNALIAPIMAQYGAIAFSQMLVKALHLTHSLVNREPGLADHAPYSYLVVRGFNDLVPVEPLIVEPASAQTPSQKC